LIEKEESIMKRVLYILTALLFLAGATAIQAGDGAHGSADQAKAMIEKADLFFKAHGKDAAYAAFTEKTEGFVLNDIYIFVVDYDGMTLAHGGNAKLVGKNMLNLKDTDGKLFIQEMINTAQKGGGWIDYKWVNPQSKKIEMKTTLVKPIEGQKAFFGCGIYK
jgi:cytochrome c